METYVRFSISGILFFVFSAFPLQASSLQPARAPFSVALGGIWDPVVYMVYMSHAQAQQYHSSLTPSDSIAAARIRGPEKRNVRRGEHNQRNSNAKQQRHQQYRRHYVLVRRCTSSLCQDDVGSRRMCAQHCCDVPQVRMVCIRIVRARSSCLARKISQGELELWCHCTSAKTLRNLRFATLPLLLWIRRTYAVHACLI